MQKQQRQQFNSRQTFTSKTKLELKRKQFSADGQDKEVVTAVGYPILWNDLSSDRGGYKVRLAANSAKFADVVHALIHHDFSKPLGNTAAGTVRIGAADDKGIPIEIDLNMDSSVGRDAAAFIDRGDMAGMSFSMANGFEEYTESKDKDEQDVVTCTAFTCDEFTITAIPAFANTTISMSDDGDDDEDKEDEEYETQEEKGNGPFMAHNKAKLKLLSL